MNAMDKIMLVVRSYPQQVFAGFLGGTVFGILMSIATPYAWMLPMVAIPSLVIYLDKK
jgi:hypothetical protein